jgi:endonuclease/exonuclease/phosphatase family metal-dependent hydrolase
MSLRVATLNIWNRLGPWEQRLPAIRRGIAAVDAHVVGLQEVVSLDGFRQAEMLAEGYGYHVAEGRHSAAVLPIGNAILSRFPVRHREVFELPTGGTIERRTLLHAVLDAPFGRVPVFVTHLNWKLDEGHVREQQVRFIADTIARVCPRDASFCPVLMGDFNAEPDSDEMRFLRGLTSLGGARTYFADAWTYAGEGQGATFARSNPFAAQQHEPDRRIDYVYVRGPDERGRGEPIGARLAFDAPHEGVFPSDHFGVVATILT